MNGSHRIKGRLKTEDEGFQTTFFLYSGLTLNQDGVTSPCRTIRTVCGFVALS
ncbi:hypothetical protein [Neisseria sicca]